MNEAEVLEHETELKQFSENVGMLLHKNMLKMTTVEDPETHHLLELKLIDPKTGEVVLFKDMALLDADYKRKKLDFPGRMPQSERDITDELKYFDSIKAGVVKGQFEQKGIIDVNTGQISEGRIIDKNTGKTVFYSNYKALNDDKWYKDLDRGKRRLH